MPNFLRNCQTVLQTAVPFYIPTNSVWGFEFLHIFQQLLLPAIFNISILVHENLTVILICVSLRANVFVVAVVVVLYPHQPFVHLLCRNVYSDLLLIFNWIIYLFIIELEEFFNYSGYKFTVGYTICMYVLPFCGVFFSFSWGYLSKHKRF